MEHEPKPALNEKQSQSDETVVGKIIAREIRLAKEIFAVGKVVGNLAPNARKIYDREIAKARKAGKLFL